METDSYELTHKDMPWRSKLGRQDRKLASEGDDSGDNVAKTSKAVFSSQNPGKKPNRPPFSRGEVLCHYHIKFSCNALKRKEGKPVSLLATQPRVIPENLLVTTLRQSPPGYEGLVSEGVVAITMDGKMAPISVLRNSGATQPLLVEGVIDLPPDTDLKVSTPVKGVEGGLVGTPLHRVFLKSNIVNGPVVVAIVPSLPVEGIDFVLGNDLAGTQVCIPPIVTKEPCEVPEIAVLEQEHPEVFTACVVTW